MGYPQQSLDEQSSPLSIHRQAFTVSKVDVDVNLTAAAEAFVVKAVWIDRMRASGAADVYWADPSGGDPDADGRGGRPGSGGVSAGVDSGGTGASGNTSRGSYASVGVIKARCLAMRGCPFLSLSFFIYSCFGRESSSALPPSLPSGRPLAFEPRAELQADCGNGAVGWRGGGLPEERAAVGGRWRPG